MYGLANKIFQDMVVEHHGEDKWRVIRAKAGVDETFFMSMGCYPDEMTYRMVGAASEVLGLPPERLLFEYGEYWIATAESEYAEMVAFAGKNLVDVLDSVDDIHARATLIFPQMQPPTFRCSHVGAESFRLHYGSVRQGLAPFVEGLVAGLGKRLETPVTSQHDKRRADGHDHEEFIVSYMAQSDQRE